MPTSGKSLNRLPKAVRVTALVVLGGLALTAIGIVAFPALMLSTTPPSSEYVLATKGAANDLADDLVFTMTDSQMNDAVTNAGARLVELDRGTTQITAIVAVVNTLSKPVAEDCYRLILKPDEHNEAIHTDQASCSVPPSK